MIKLGGKEFRRCPCIVRILGYIDEMLPLLVSAGITPFEKEGQSSLGSIMYTAVDEDQVGEKFQDFLKSLNIGWSVDIVSMTDSVLLHVIDLKNKRYFGLQTDVDPYKIFPKSKFISSTDRRRFDEFETYGRGNFFGKCFIEVKPPGEGG